MAICVLHHSAASDIHPQFSSVVGYHRKKFGTKNSAYHCFIERDGTVIFANDPSVHLPHSGNSQVNKDSVGICLAGDFTKESPASVQILALQGVLEHYRLHHGITEIKLHREVKNGETSCPGVDLRLYLSPVLSPVAHLNALRRSLLRATGAAARAIGRAIARIIHTEPFSLPPS